MSNKSNENIISAGSIRIALAIEAKAKVSKIFNEIKDSNEIEEIANKYKEVSDIFFDLNEKIKIFEGKDKDGN